jgi:hypothetical protein
MRDTFYSEGGYVFQAAREVVDTDGTTRVTMGFRILEVDEYVVNRERVAQVIAQLLTEHWKDEDDA